MTISGLVIETGNAALNASGRACLAATLVSMGPITREVVIATTDVSSAVYFVWKVG